MELLLEIIDGRITPRISTKDRIKTIRAITSEGVAVVGAAGGVLGEQVPLMVGPSRMPRTIAITLLLHLIVSKTHSMHTKIYLV